MIRKCIGSKKYKLGYEDKVIISPV